MAFTPNPNLFNQSVGGGLNNAKSLLGMIEKRKQQSKLQEIAASLPQNNPYEIAGSKLVELGMVQPGMNMMNALQDRQFEQSKLEALQNKPYSTLGKLAADLKAGRISQADYNAGVNKANKVGGVNVNIGSSFKVPSGYMLNPEDPNSVIPIKGGDKDPNTQTAAMRNEMMKMENSAKVLDAGLNDYLQLIQQSGTEIVPGKAKDALLTARRDIQLEAKELFNLGVLNGPDLALMDELLIDPTEITTAILNGTGFADIQERAASNIAQLKKLFQRKKDARLRLPDSNQGNQNNATDIDALLKKYGD